MCAANGTDHLDDISKGHIDGSIYCHEANPIFAEKMKEIGAQLRVPTTINAISVDRELWPLQSVAPDFADKAAVTLADAYVSIWALRLSLPVHLIYLKARLKQGKILAGLNQML